MENTLLSCLTILASLFLGFLAGYMRKKGENRAIHEDLDKLVLQVKTTTKQPSESKLRFHTRFGTGSGNGNSNENCYWRVHVQFQISSPQFRN